MKGDGLRLRGVSLVADPSGALWWPERGTLVVADLHLDKGAALARRGRPLPPLDTAATLERLESVIRRLRPMRIVSLGDGFHEGAVLLRAADATRLRTLVASVEWIWVAGNHDPAAPDGLGRAVPALELDGLVLRHLPTGAEGEVAGHLHPKARVRLRGASVSRRCFVSDRARLILPAFGSYAGGLDVTDPRVAQLFPDGFVARLLGRGRVFALPDDRLDR